MHTKHLKIDLRKSKDELSHNEILIEQLVSL